MTRIATYRIVGVVVLLGAIAYVVIHATRGSSPQHANAAEQAAPAQTGAGGGNFPAFHNGGPLLGVAGPIGGPPMRLQWQFKSEDDPAPGTQPGGPTSIVTP